MLQMMGLNNDNENFIYNIGILEIQRHIPVLYSFMKICKTNKTKVTVFTTPKVFTRLLTYDINKNDFIFIIKKKSETKLAFLRRVKKICNKEIDLLFINTIHSTVFDLLHYINFDTDIKKVLVVHHANAWIRPYLVFKPFNILKTIDSNFSTVLIKNFIFPKFDAINVIYSPLRKYIYENMDYNKEIFTIPTSTFEEDLFINNYDDNDKLKIVLPGIIQEHRKDYLSLLNAFSNICKKYKNKIEVYILGQPIGSYGKQVVKKYKNLNKKDCKVVTYDGFVPDDIFDKILNYCDIIITPLRFETKADNLIKEQYGKTVGSGVVYNAIKYARPIIVPEEFNMIGEFSSSTLKYQNHKDLEKILEGLINHPNKIMDLKHEALKNSRKFTLENLQKYFNTKVIGWLEKQT